MGKNLFKTEDLIAKVAEVRGTTKVEARKEFDGVLEALKLLIQDETHDGVALYGIGNIEVKEKQAREYRNPKTGESVPKGTEEYLSVKLSKKVRKLDF